MATTIRPAATSIHGTVGAYPLRGVPLREGIVRSELYVIGQGKCPEARNRPQRHGACLPEPARSSEEKDQKNAANTRMASSG